MENSTEIKIGFEKWGFSKEVMSAITKLGYTTPTPVQEACIPYLLETKGDLLALAKTGTGKTAAFGLPLVERTTADKKLQALVLCPTRELAAQVGQHLQTFGQQKGLKVVTIVGGESYRRQIDAIKAGPQILVSTPGRLIDLIDQKVISLTGVNYFILDEADEMLSFGFQDALETVWKKLEENEFNTWLFSATMNDSIRRLTSKYLTKAHEVVLNRSNEIINLDSYAAVVFEEDKNDALSLLIQNNPQFYGIIFAQTKQQVANLEIRFRNMGLQVDSLHGDKVQAERTRTINRLKKKEIKILVATDVAARGLDIQDLTHVVNYELPWDVETYTHRVGRTARAGKAGTVWTLVRPKECQFLRKFERSLKFNFKPLKVPTVDEIRSAQIRRWLSELASTEVKQQEQALFENTILDLGVEKSEVISEDTKQWLMKMMTYAKVGANSNLKQPRTFDLRPSDTGGGGGGRDNRPSSYGRDNRDSRDNRGGGSRGGRAGGGYSGGGRSAGPRSAGGYAGRSNSRPSNNDWSGGGEQQSPDQNERYHQRSSLRPGRKFESRDRDFETAEPRNESFERSKIPARENDAPAEPRTFKRKSFSTGKSAARPYGKPGKESSSDNLGSVKSRSR